MSLSLASKVCLVFGASGGIGSAICRRAASSGASVICAGRNLDAIRDLASEIDGAHYQCNATENSEVEACISFCLEKYGRLDGVVNAVGSILLKPAHLTSYDDWRQVIATNLDSAFLCLKHGAKAMMGKGGSVVLFSSAAASIGLPNHEAVAAAKAGVEGLMLAAAASYARSSVRVNCLAPGLVETGLTQAITKNPLQLEASVKMHPLGRIGLPEDIAPLAILLLSDEASWISGQVIGVDGGLGRLKGRA